MSTEKETTFCTHKGYNTVAPCGKDCPTNQPIEEKWNENVETCSDCGIQWKKIGKSCQVCFAPAEPKHEEPIEEKWKETFVEAGANIEHDRWARWQKYMFSKGTVDENGVFHLPKEFVERWFRQIDTKYADLSEPEKESDRKESRTYIPLVKQAITTAVETKEKSVIEILERHASWKPTEGHGSEEELGFQKGLMAEAKLIKSEILSIINPSKE